MKERPILFSGPMVRAILDGTKTQTRRVVKPQFAADAIPVEMPATDPAGGWVVPGHSGVWWCDAAANPDDVRRCPYGQPGDRLWVREAWARTRVFGAEMVVYREGDNRTDYGGPWKPSIHMPRWASRITLEITSVRVERLQDISEADAIAEGVYTDPASPAYDAYAQLWDEINGPGSWAANPWVWVLEFRRLNVEHSQC